LPIQMIDWFGENGMINSQNGNMTVKTAQDKPMGNQQTTAIVSSNKLISFLHYTGSREQRTDQKCLTNDNDSGKQAMDGKEIEAITSPSYTGQENV